METYACLQLPRITFEAFFLFLSFFKLLSFNSTMNKSKMLSMLFVLSHYFWSSLLIPPPLKDAENSPKSKCLTWSQAMVLEIKT